MPAPSSQALACSTSSPMWGPVQLSGMPLRLMATTAAWKRLRKAAARMLLPLRSVPAGARGRGSARGQPQP